MHQLDSTDTHLIESEALGPPQHLSAILIYDPPADPIGRLHYREILDTLKRNLHTSAVFRRRLLRAPLNIDRPYWTEDDHFDLDYHVRHIALPQPGNWSQLRQLLTRLHAAPLDMSRPLWEGYVIEGLNALPGHRPGSFALLLKVHHSAAKNAELIRLITGLHQSSPTDDAPAAPPVWRAAPSPTALHMLTRAYLNGLRHPATLLKSAVHHTPVLGRLTTLSRAGTEHGLQEEQRCRFNAPITRDRVTDLLLIKQATLLSIMASVARVTAYDALACIIGGALREYLAEKGELPSLSLTLALPEQVDAGLSATTQSTSLISRQSLGTDVEHPLERLRAVHASATAHSHSEAMPNELAETAATTGLWTAPVSPQTNATRRLSSLTAHAPAYLADSRLSSTMAMPALTNNMGLMHSALHHEDTITLMFVACRESLPDPDCYLRCLRNSLRDLSEAARHQ